jgi:hypothetical protein
MKGEQGSGRFLLDRQADHFKKNKIRRTVQEVKEG